MIDEAIDLSSNYQHWREEGHLWQKEYDNRKTFLAYYHIQELMLANYVINSHATRVLEYGCGVGRHLNYLSKIPGVDVYGYDQSQGMVDHIHAWASSDWFNEHVAVGLPVTRLPYEDNAFDIVYTSEVLIHISPADLPFVLSELIRIARWQVLHLEPTPSASIIREAHNGSWNHDLVSLYAKLGLHCDILPSGFASQVPYRVVLDQEPSLYTWSPVELGLYRRLEQDLQPTLHREQLAQEQNHDLQTQLSHTQTYNQQVIADRDRLWAEVQLWKRDYDTTEAVLATLTADRDRLWAETQQWQVDYEQTQTALGTFIADRDRLWAEVQQWQADAEQAQTTLATTTADRDRLWVEIQQSQVDSEQTLGALTADRDRLWTEIQQWQTDAEQAQTALATMTADRDRLWVEVQQWQAEYEATQTALVAQCRVAQQELARMQQSQLWQRTHRLSQSTLYKYARQATYRIRSLLR